MLSGEKMLATAHEITSLVRPDEIGEVTLYTGAIAIPLVQHSYYALRGHVDAQSAHMIQRCFSALLVSSQLKSLPSALLATNAVKIHSDLSQYTHLNSCIKGIRGTIRSNLPLPLAERNAELRKNVQGVYDFVSNFSRLREVSSEVVSFWSCVHSAIDKNSYDFDAHVMRQGVAKFVDGKTWALFETSLLDSADAWSLWLGWYKYRFAGVSDGKYPSFLWRHWEKEVAQLSVEVWDRSPNEVNKLLSEIALKILDEFVDNEVRKDQNKKSITFNISDRIHIDKIYDENFDDRKNKIVSEIISNVSRLVERCNDNSSIYVKQDAEDYVSLFNDDSWGSSSSVVIRGNKLRVHLARQEESVYNREIPSLNEKALVELENVVGIHNLLVQTSPDLKLFDDQLRNIDGNSTGDPRVVLRRIIATAEAASALDENTQSILKSLPEYNNFDDDVIELRIHLVIENLIRSVMRFLWEKKKAIGIGLAGTPPAVYAIGKWALANEAVLTGYFAEGSNMSIVLKAVMQWLHSLPLL